MNKVPIKTILNVAKNLFVVALIIYLVLFLLEITLPGFVSNSFNLNWILAIVIILGLLTALAPMELQEKKPEKPKRTDYLMFVGLGIVGGLLIFFKSNLAIWSRIILAGVGAILTSGFPIILMIMEGKPDEELETEPEPFKTNYVINTVLPQIRRLILKPISLPFGAILIIFLLLGLNFLKPTVKKEVKNLTQNKSEVTLNDQKDMVVFAPFLAENKADYIPQPSRQELKETPISIFNGSTQVGSASAMAKFLKTKDFTISRVEDADNSDYQDAIIRFSLDKMKIAEYLADAIAGTYPIVERAPTATDSGEIILILGNLQP